MPNPTVVRRAVLNLSEKDQLVVYDNAVASWIQECPLRLKDGKPLRVVFATPDRAFARMREILKEELGEKNAIDVRLVPFPFASVTRGDWSFDYARFHGDYNTFVAAPHVAPAGVSVEGTEGDDAGEGYWQTEFPKPVNLEFQVDLWSRERSPLNIFQQWIQFSGETDIGYLRVDFSSLWPEWGEKLVAYTQEGGSDVSELEPEEGERILRATVPLTVHGWLLPDMRVTRSVRKLGVEWGNQESPAPPPWEKYVLDEKGRRKA